MDWDKDISALGLSDAEKNGLQVYRNYEKSFNNARLVTANKEVDEVGFDLEQLTRDLEFVVSARMDRSILSAASIADEYLISSYKREHRTAIKIKELLQPLGPLGNFSKRLKVAALAGFIDDECFNFWDAVRRVRNEIAHSRTPGEPTRDQLITIIETSPILLDALAESPGIEFDKEKSETQIWVRAVTLIHIGKLAWESVALPIARKHRVLSRTVVHNPPQVFRDVSRISVGRALQLLAAA